MKGIILLNGEPYSGKVDTDDSFVVCCDGAFSWARDARIRIDKCIGDFDSLPFVPDGAEVYPIEKDKTDGEVALDILISKGVEKIEIYGGSGKREDHFFGNVGLMLQARERGINAVFFSDYTEFFVACGKVSLDLSVGTTISLVPVTEMVHINRTEGLKYDASGLIIKRGESRGLSNITTRAHSEILIERGTALIFIVRKI